MGDHGAEHSAALPALLGLHYLPIVIFVALLLLDQGARRRLPPAARMMGGLRRLSPALRLALLLVLVSATVHISLLPAHLTQPVTAALFALDAIMEVALCVLACLGVQHWRRFGAALMTANLAAYVTYVVAGLERPDGVGAVTKLVELIALVLFSLSVAERSVVSGMEVTSS